jgi:hypothetical protein
MRAFYQESAMPAQIDRQAVENLLYELDRRDPERKLFGSNVHQYKLRPTLPRTVIDAFERQHSVAFPQDYKFFITEIGDGGAGPYYGLFPFGQHDDCHDYCNWQHGHLVGDFSKPFPHLTDWNLPDSFWSNLPDLSPGTPTEVQDRIMEAWDKELEEKYWNPSLVNGAIPICDLGCALRQWLIINGAQKGYVWRDDRVDNKGLYPVKDEKGNQVTFWGWYSSWLHDTLKKVSTFLPNKSSD